MFSQVFIVCLTIGLVWSAPAASPNPEPNPAPAPAPKPGLAPLVVSSPVALSYNAFSALQAHPSIPQVVVKSAPALQTAAVVPSIPTVYSAPAAAVGYAVNYPSYVVV